MDFRIPLKNGESVCLMNMVAGGDADGHQDRWLIWRGCPNVLQVDRRRVANRFCLIDGGQRCFDCVVGWPFA